MGYLTNDLKLDKDMKHFAAEIKICFSKEELEEIARETGFVKRKGKIRYFSHPPEKGE